MQQLSTITKTIVLTGFSALSLFAITPAQAASFRSLGIVYSDVTAISADGSVLVGSIKDYDEALGYYSEAFRWTQADGLVRLGFLDNYNSYATDVSADGSVVIGYSNTSARSRSFRWTQETGMVSLESDNFSLAYHVIANGVSADGSVIVGIASFPSPSYKPDQAFRWTQSSGMLSLGSLPYGVFSVAADVSADGSGMLSLGSLPYGVSSVAADVSADGSVIVGVRVNGASEEAFRWTQETGTVGLGVSADFSNGYIGSDLSFDGVGISADGSVVIGYSINANGDQEAFRWTQETGMMDLGSLDPNVASSTAKDVSADGSIVVGYSRNANGSQEAFRWTQETGMVSLKETLIGAGLDVSGWTLDEATGISADGFTIVGNGINPSGQTEGWVAHLSPEPIPEPLTILGSVAAIAFAAGFERKFSKNKSDEKDPDA